MRTIKTHDLNVVENQETLKVNNDTLGILVLQYLAR